MAVNVGRRPSVYLAGPVTGCLVRDACDWREYMSERLARHGIVGISPLRCEPPGIDGRYQMEYADPRFGMPRALGAKNRLDVLASDMTLAYLPVPPPGS